MGDSRCGGRAPRRRRTLGCCWSRPDGAAVRFPLNHTQCTNECSDRTYAVTVVDFPDPTAGSPWIQSWDPGR